jgi:TolA-binding protein
VLDLSSFIAKAGQFFIIEREWRFEVSKKTLISMALLFASSPLFAATPKNLNAFKEGERVIYGRLVEAYRRGQLPEVYRQRQLLERNYPQSVHLDNAIFLTGMLEFQNNRLGEAVRTFNTVTDRYPKSNKRPAALFGLAMSYKRLNLKPLSVRVLNTIQKEYPGSPESARAAMHLRVEKSSEKSTLKR